MMFMEETVPFKHLSSWFKRSHCRSCLCLGDIFTELFYFKFCILVTLCSWGPCKWQVLGLHYLAFISFLSSFVLVKCYQPNHEPLKEYFLDLTDVAFAVLRSRSPFLDLAMYPHSSSGCRTTAQDEIFKRRSNLLSQGITEVFHVQIIQI